MRGDDAESGEGAEAMNIVERRQVKRMKFKVPVELETANHLDKSRPFRLQGETENLSERGVCFAKHADRHHRGERLGQVLSGV